MIDMVLPTGAMGNITGGYMAKQMGVPIRMLCAGVNINGMIQHAAQNMNNACIGNQQISAQFPFKTKQTLLTGL